VEAILDGRQPADFALPALLEGLPADWERQRSHGFAPPDPTIRRRRDRAAEDRP
jgi:hypothetical protein